MKNTVAFVLALAALVMIAQPASAASGSVANKPGATPFALAGRIVALDTTTKTVTVQVLSGNSAALKYLGQNLVLTTTSATRFLLQGTSTATPISFGYLQVGQSVSANGLVSDGLWVATRITVGADLIHR